MEIIYCKIFILEREYTRIKEKIQNLLMLVREELEQETNTRKQKKIK